MWKNRLLESVMYLAKPQSTNNDTAVNRFFMVFDLLLLIYVVVSTLWGEKMAWYLLCTDKYSGKKIKIRWYGVIRTCIIEILLLLAIIYCFLYKISSLIWLFAFVLLGYTWIKFQIYSSSVEYTNSRLRVYLRKRLLHVILFSNIEKMEWCTGRGRIMKELTIFCYTGEKITLSSAHFVGLVKLRSTYEKQKSK